MLVSTSPHILSQVNGYDIGGYTFNRRQVSASILVDRFWVEGSTSTYVDTVGVQLTPEETVERMSAVINGKSMTDELYPWAIARAKADGAIPPTATVQG